MTTDSSTSLDIVVDSQTKGSAVARYAPVVARVLFGLAFLVFGLNGFLDFLPKPSSAPPEKAMAFAGAMVATGYLFPLVKGTEVVVGVLMLANRFVPLGLALIAPIIVNIVAFHVFLAPEGTGLTLFLLALEIYLAWSYRDAFRPMLRARVQAS